MGGVASTNSSSTDRSSARMSRELRMLLGNFERLDPVAQRLVTLGKKCLTSTVLDSQTDNFRRLDKFVAKPQDRSEDDHVLFDRQSASSRDHDNFDPVEFANTRFDNENPEGIENQPQVAQIESSNAEASASNANTSENQELFLPLEQARPIYLGQTYPRWKSMYRIQNLYAMCVPTRRIIYIQPIDEFPDFLTDFRIVMKSLSLDIFSLLQGFTQIFFSGLDVTVLPSLSMDRMGWQNLVKSRHHKVTCEKQYHAGSFYPLLQQTCPSDGHCILGLIWTDLYPEEDLNFTLGETSFNHRAGIFCFGRFETKGFNRATHKDITEVDGFLMWKLIRVLSHELCHLFGLRHCTYFRCSMNESTSMTEAMDQPLFLCPVCLRKLHEVCRFDVLDRYRQLLAFLQELQSNLPSVQCDRAIIWLENCIVFLQQPSSAD